MLLATIRRAFISRGLSILAFSSHGVDVSSYASGQASWPHPNCSFSSPSVDRREFSLLAPLYRHSGVVMRVYEKLLCC